MLKIKQLYFFIEKYNKTTKKVVVYSKHSVYLQR